MNSSFSFSRSEVEGLGVEDEMACVQRFVAGIELMLTRGTRWYRTSSSALMTPDSERPYSAEDRFVMTWGARIGSEVKYP